MALSEPAQHSEEEPGCREVSQRLHLVPLPWGCGGEGEELLVQENPEEDGGTYKVTCPDTRMLHKLKELQKQ